MGVRQALLCLFIFVGYCHSFAFADFIWPLQQNNGISATFGESRDDHFHAGIDLSTNGDTGLPVLAVADGFIYRMKIQKRAYGKALYIRHADGRQTLYAHLESYSSELGLQKIYLDKTQQMQTPYVGDIFIEPAIPVKQGEIVAYSGESGAGLPHLHFEVRKNESLAVNPLQNGLHDTLDPIPPTFQALYFYPMNANSAVNGSLDTKEVRFKKNDSGFAGESVPIVRGDFVLSVSVYDSALRPYHRGLQKLTYSIDGRELYSVNFDQISYSQPDGFGLFYDLGKPGPSYYEFPVMLSKSADFPVPFVNKHVTFSTSTLTPGNHKITIQAGDSNNNQSIAEVPFIVNRPPSFDLDPFRKNETDLITKGTIAESNGRGTAGISTQVEFSIDEGKKFQPFSKTALDASSYEFRAPLDALRKPRSILVRARAFDGVEYSPYQIRRIRLNSTPMEQAPEKLTAGNLRYETYREAIQVIFETDAPIVGKVTVNSGEPAIEFPLEARETTSRTAFLPVPKKSGSITVNVKGGSSLNIPVDFGYARKPVTIENKSFKLMIPEDSLYFDTFLWSKLLPEYRSKSLPLMGPILQLGPRGLPLNKDAELSFPYRTNVIHPEKLSIYRWDRVHQRWSSLPSILDRDSKTIRTRISYFDLYVVLYDNVAPVIQNVFPKRRSVTSNDMPTLVANIRDLGMDVDDEKVTFLVDGVSYAAEYDPDRNAAKLKMSKSLKKGAHTFAVKAEDYGGNRTQSPVITFRVR